MGSDWAEGEGRALGAAEPLLIQLFTEFSFSPLAATDQQLEVGGEVKGEGGGPGGQLVHGVVGHEVGALVHFTVDVAGRPVGDTSSCC